MWLLIIIMWVQIPQVLKTIIYLYKLEKGIIMLSAYACISANNLTICFLSSKGISSNGRATVLHTVGQVFKSPIPYT